MKLNQETAESLMRLAHNRDFQTFGSWLDAVHVAFTNHAIVGDEKTSPDVLRGRAQAIGILKNELEKAPEVAGRIQKIS